MAKKGKSKKELDDPTFKSIAKNRRAYHDYEVLDTFEAGLVLLGTEVKSLRNGNVSFNDAHARIKNNEVWLHQLHIAPYAQGGYFNHAPTRPRKLLLHRKEITSIDGRMGRMNLTLVPIELYFRGGRAKLKFGVCRGKKKADKRQALRKRQDDRTMQRALRSRD
ncbi:MAG: SsrA-binding protein SmpB [Planctomycetes bacterium]|nr:SsrA-binding protein SmpB [Planctomycetota bacterium]